MVAIPLTENSRYESNFLPADPGSILPKQGGHTYNDSNIPQYSDVLPPILCRTNISFDVIFNFSESVLCDIIAESQHTSVLPPATEAVLVIVYVVLMASGIVSNLLVCFVVVRQCSRKKLDLGSTGPKSRNLYIVNLAVADLALCCICMPFTLVRLIHQGWTLGSLLCKMVPVLQGTNIMVSSGTITAIALDRYFTIVRSPKSRARSSRACVNVAATITTIWLASFLVTLPLFFYNQVESVDFEGLVLYEQCMELWPSAVWKGLFTFLMTIVQFVIPVLVLTTIHLRISAYLHLHLKPINKSKPKIQVHSPDEVNIRNEKEDVTLEKENTVTLPKDDVSNKELLSIKRKESVCSDNSQRSYDSLRKSSDCSRKNSDCSETKRSSDACPRKRSDFLASFRETSEISGFSFSKLSSERSQRRTHKRARRELRRNRRTMFILSCIAVVYAVSWLPLNVFHFLDLFKPDYFTRPNTVYLAFACCHVLAMSTAITNPLLYGWLNTNFRREFSLIFSSLSVKFSNVFKRQFNNKTTLITTMDGRTLVMPLNRRYSLTVVTAKLDSGVLTTLQPAGQQLPL